MKAIDTSFETDYLIALFFNFACTRIGIPMVIAIEKRTIQTKQMQTGVIIIFSISNYS